MPATKQSHFKKPKEQSFSTIKVDIEYSISSQKASRWCTNTCTYVYLAWWFSKYFHLKVCPWFRTSLIISMCLQSEAVLLQIRPYICREATDNCQWQREVHNVRGSCESPVYSPPHVSRITFYLSQTSNYISICHTSHTASFIYCSNVWKTVISKSTSGHNVMCHRLDCSMNNAQKDCWCFWSF